MEIATGALLSASVQQLIERLTSHQLKNFARGDSIHADIRDLERKLVELNTFLDDAEAKQETDAAVKYWLDDLRDLIYDIEDVLDEFNTEALKSKVIPSFLFKNKMVSRIKEITLKLDFITVSKETTLNLRRIANKSRSNQLKERPPTTPLIDESHIYGRDGDKQAILQMLLREEGCNDSIPVIAILGMGGIGKTTLAQLVYNDSAVEGFFDIRAWVCVSENFDVNFLTRTILRQVDPEIGDLKDLDLYKLQVKLKEKLSRKKFLLVLDDVWEEDFNQWERLRIPFISASSSSKIVVTTRKKNVAPIRGDAYAYRVKELPDDECLSILARRAFASFDAHLDLKEIGQELVKWCDGLPLAVKVLGGLLRNKQSRGEWELIRNQLWNTPETSQGILPILKLSYYDLPAHLKRCFVYCAIIPRDYEFDRDELVSLWMGEGFLDHPQGGKLMEDLGIEYFEDLVARSFFQSSNGSQSTSFYQSGLYFEATNSTRSLFVMHGLISDLAQIIAKDTCYNYENHSEADMSSSKYEKVRHASFSFLKDSQEYEVYSRMKNLRTIVGFPILRRYDRNALNNYLRQKDCYQFSPQSRCLRVLSLTVWGLPKSIGDLKHLRHLNLSFAPIEELPESVSTLLNLLTLLLHCCDHLKKLPDKTRKLLKLRHLDISKTPQLRKLPSRIGMLTNLQTLSKFIVDRGNGTTIVELENLNNLRGRLSIEGLQNVQDGKPANLKEKQGLEELVLKWTGHGRNDKSVLESLEPHLNLKRLTIWSYGGAEFPSWVSNMYLVSLNLKDCGETELLPPLGQLNSMKELSIDGLKAVKTIGVEFYGNFAVPFPSLERLEIGDMSEWREWSHGDMGGEGFPNLQELRLYDCPKLIGSLPSGLHRLRRLSELEIIKCEKLESFPPMGLPYGLRRITVKSCDALKCFPTIHTGDSEQSLLEYLAILQCASLRFERNFKLPTSLRKLRIQRCGNLLSLPDGLMMRDDNENQPQSHLEYLEIDGCLGLTSLPTGKFPAALKILDIQGCSLELESAILEKNMALERIFIWDNYSLRALPSIDHLQSLSELIIGHCPKVLSLMETGGVPGSLTTLEIEQCANLGQPIAEWGLGMLSSLEILEVRGRCPATAGVVSFPDDNCCWLPTSLKKLYISDFLNLESVSMGLQKLTSLQTLEIRDCPKLQSLPREALPVSLQRLSIYGCPRLKNTTQGEKKGEYSGSAIRIENIYSLSKQFPR